MKAISLIGRVVIASIHLTIASTSPSSVYLCSDDPTVKSGPPLIDCAICARAPSESTIAVPSPNTLRIRSLEDRAPGSLVWCPRPEVTTYIVITVLRALPLDQSQIIRTLLNQALDILTLLVLHPRAHANLPAAGWSLPSFRGTKLTIWNYDPRVPVTCIDARDAVLLMRDFMKQHGVGLAIAYIYSNNAEVGMAVLTTDDGS